MSRPSSGRARTDTFAGTVAETNVRGIGERFQSRAVFTDGFRLRRVGIQGISPRAPNQPETVRYACSTGGGIPREHSPSSPGARDRPQALVQPDVGAPGGTRTPDTQVRSLVLYPTELRARGRRGKGRCWSAPFKCTRDRGGPRGLVATHRAAVAQSGTLRGSCSGSARVSCRSSRRWSCRAMRRARCGPAPPTG